MPYHVWMVPDLVAALALSFPIPATELGCPGYYYDPCEAAEFWTTLTPHNAAQIPSDGVLVLQGARHGTWDDGATATVELAVTLDGQPVAGALERSPMPGVLVKISEEGEIQIKSPGQLVGYYKRPDLDAESFTADGYFKTGDRGERRADGLLKITGRVKEIFKTSKGEYVSPAPIENRIQANPMVESCMVSGAGQAAAYAMIVLNETLRPKQNDPAVRAEVEAELGKLLGEVNSHLVGHEKLQFLVIAKEPWTIENGSLTPTMKIKRSRIESDVSPKVETWYAGKGKVQWA